MILGITGTDGAGKGSVVEYLVREKGYTHYSSRAFILEHIEKNGLPKTRNQLRLTANELRKQYGNDFVIRQALLKALRDRVQNAVIESIRAIAEADYLKSKGGVLLAIDADQTLRYKRITARRSESDQVSFEEFKAHEDLEANDSDPHGMQKRRVIAMADYTIMNNGTREELYAQVEIALTQLHSQPD